MHVDEMLPVAVVGGFPVARLEQSRIGESGAQQHPGTRRDHGRVGLGRYERVERARQALQGAGPPDRTRIADGIECVRCHARKSE